MQDPAWAEHLDAPAQEYLDDERLLSRPTEVQVLTLLLLAEIRELLRRFEPMLTVP